MLILGLGCYVLTVLQQHMGFTPGIHDLAPAYVFMCAAAFLGLRAIYRPGPVRDKWILAVGKHSLTVYLCHGMILSQVSTRLPEMAFLPRLALTMAVTTAVSLAAAFVVGSLVLFPLQRLVQKHL